LPFPFLSEGGAVTKQERLEECYRGFLADLGNISPEFRQCIYEDLKLQFEYPGEWVAWYDEWLEQGRGKPPKLVRHLIAHGQDFGKVYDVLEQLGRDGPDWQMTLTEEENDGREVVYL
jgi:hypothetical protein